MSAADPPRVIVTAAVIEEDGRLLVTRRVRGTHLEGLWEFPGGKCDPGETLQSCLERELREELGVGARVGREVFTVAHEYPERIVELHFFECRVTGNPRPRLGQEMRWVTRADLGSLTFPPADDELIARLIGSST
jgi:8-oxo-dGTP diphosphatase